MTTLYQVLYLDKWDAPKNCDHVSHLISHRTNKQPHEGNENTYTRSIFKTTLNYQPNYPSKGFTKLLK